MAMNRAPSDSPASCTGRMLGSSRDAATRDSRRNRSRNRGSPARSGARTLRATFRPRATCSARYTTPIPPRPTTDSMRYPAMVVPMRESVAMFPPRSSTPDGEPEEASAEQLGEAVADGRGELGLGPGPQGLVVPGGGQDHGVVGIRAEPRPLPSNPVDHDQVQALRGQLAPPGGLQVSGLRGEPHQHGPGLQPTQLPQDVRGGDELQGRRAGFLLQ